MKYTPFSEIIGAVAFTIAAEAQAARIDFTGLSRDGLFSPDGQTFRYAVGAHPTPTGSVNVRRLSGDALDIFASGNYTRGIYVQQQTPNLTPLVLRFTFSRAEDFLVEQNETLTNAETNHFSSYGLPWTVVSSSNLSAINSSGNVTSVTGSVPAPFGDFTLRAQARSF